MKKKRVVKLLSLSMAGILAVSSCNVAGSVVFAEEANVQEEMQEDVVKEGNELQESDEAEEKGAQESSVADETSKEVVEEATEEVVEETTEEATEEVVEETTEELTELLHLILTVMEIVRENLILDSQQKKSCIVEHPLLLICIFRKRQQIIMDR